MGRKMGRNEPCPCGSGKKYKKCCLGRDVELKPRETSRSSSYQVSQSLGSMSPGISITPYSAMKMTENPSPHFDAELRAKIAQHMRDNWTSDKVARMETEAIEDQLRVYGVEHSRERFLLLAGNRFSAWNVAEVWLNEDDVTCAGTKEEDFLGIAACALWKRWAPDRPSMEMLDDWMQEGYQHQQEGKSASACDIWWKVWQVLVSRFDPSMRTMHAVEPVFSGMQSVFNWSQDFEMELHNASVDAVRYAEIGRDYCEQWLAQFRDEDDPMLVSFRRALSEFLFRLGKSEEGEAILLNNIKRWPSNVWGYVGLADAYSHLFRGASSLPLDLRRAEELLRKGLSVIGDDDRDREVLEERLQEIHERRSESQSSPPAPTQPTN